jgi:predicted permease
MLTLLHGPDPQQIRAARVDDAYARVFSIRPLFGRFFTPNDLRPEAPRVAVLAYDLWVREFGGDRRVVGSVISLNNTPHEIIGVLPLMSFAYPVSPVHAFVPLRIPPGSMLNNRGAMAVQAVGKMKPGMTVEQARAQVKAVAARLALQFPASNTGIGPHVESLRTAVVGPVRDMLVLLGGVVAAVLLIACVNIANLLLGQSQARTRELAVRAALGGSAARLRRQLLTESLGSALIGGVLGIALAPLLTKALVALYPGGLPRANEIGVDPRVLMLAAGATLIAGVAAGVPAARRAARLDLTQDLRSGSRAATRGSRAGGLLVVSQLALSLALVFASGLLLRTFAGLTRVDPGFDANGVITFRLSPPGIKYDTPERLRAFYSAVERSIASMPGVRAVATATLLPFGGDSFGDVFVREDVGDQGTRNPRANIVVATPGFETALGLRVAAGRVFVASDDSTSERVVLINEALAKQTYGGVNPIGQYIQWGFGPHWRIVGVVASVHTDGLWDDPGPQLYAPALQAPRWPRFVIVRAALPVEQLVPVIRTALRGIDATIPITDVATMQRRVSESLAPHRFRAALVGGLGLVAVLLSVIGIYGVVGHAVTSRTREIGIRMALGDEAARVRGHVVAAALRLALAGAGLGVVLALGVGQWLSGFLVGVQPRDPGMLAGATAVLFAVTLVAAYGPARRASRVDPIVALRSE